MVTENEARIWSGPACFTTLHTDSGSLCVHVGPGFISLAFYKRRPSRARIILGLVVTVVLSALLEGEIAIAILERTLNSSVSHLRTGRIEALLLAGSSISLAHSLDISTQGDFLSLNFTRNNEKVFALVSCLLIIPSVGIFFILSPPLPIPTPSIHNPIQMPSGTGTILTSGTVNPEDTSSSTMVQSGFSVVPLLLSNPTRSANGKASPQATSAIVVATTPSPGFQGQPEQIVAAFEGTDFGGPPFYNTCACWPPDVQIAVGPSHIVEFVNTEGVIWSKGFTFLKNFTLNSLFNTPDTLGGSKILFDSQSGRWFASIQDTVLSGTRITAGSVKIAVSTTSDPTGTFTLYSVADSGKFPDTPRLGLSDDKVVVSANMFNLPPTTYLGTELWVLNKTQMVAGTSPSFAHFGPNITRFSDDPAQSLTSTSTLFIVGDDASLYTQVWLTKVTGTPPGTVTVTSQAIATATAAIPPSALQPSTSFTLDTGNGGILDAVWSGNNLWSTWNDACTPPRDTIVRSCARIIEVNTAPSTASLTQDFDFGNMGQYFFYPAIRPDSQGNLDIIFGYSSSTVFPSLAVTMEQVGQMNNVTSSSPILTTGNSAVTSTNDACPLSNVCKYGDYFGAAVDPGTPTVVWVGGEYITTSSPWQTRLASMTFTSQSVGGEVSAVNKLGLLAPYIGFLSLVSATMALTSVYLKRIKSRKDSE